MKSFCSYYNQGRCQSCGLITFDYHSQLAQKQSLLKSQLEKFSPAVSLPPVASKEKSFRNKAKLVVTGDLENPVLGLIDREILDCPVHHPKINELLNKLVEFIKLAKLSPYQIQTQKGELKGVIVFVSEETQEMYLRFVLRSQESITRIQKFLPELGNIEVVSANIQPIPHAILEGPTEVFLTEKHFLSIKLGKIEFKIHPQGFVQTNQTVAKKLYETASEWVKELNTITFCELFSGQGAFSFFCADSVQKAYGVEINEQAVKRANQTVAEKKLTNLEFIASDVALVEHFLEELSPDLILVNPPRRGLGSAIDLFEKHRPKYIIYSSCNSQTLAQDLEKLSLHYSVDRYQIFDMFPHTEHFETLLLLIKKEY